MMINVNCWMYRKQNRDLLEYMVTHPDSKGGVYIVVVWKKSLLCFNFQPNQPWHQQTHHQCFHDNSFITGQSSHSYNRHSRVVVISFHQLRPNHHEHSHSKFTCPWEEEYIQTCKNVIVPHTSVVLSSPEWRRQEIGMTASCLSRLWRQTARDDVMVDHCSWAFTRLFVMCDLQLPPCCFICDLVFPG